MPKLDRKTIQNIKRDLCRPNVTQAQVAEKHGVSRSFVSDINTGRVHKDVPWPTGKAPVNKSGGQRKASKGYDPTHERVLELESEVLMLRDELSRERRRANANAKSQGLFKAIADMRDVGLHGVLSTGR